MSRSNEAIRFCFSTLCFVDYFSSLKLFRLLYIVYYRLWFDIDAEIAFPGFVRT